MSQLAAQLILHPQVTQGLGLVGTTLGRDKVSEMLRVDALVINPHLPAGATLIAPS